MRKKILVAGATGYIGTHLVAALRQGGYPLRCLVRNPDAFENGQGCEVVRGDLLDAASLRTAFEGIDTAFYLVHSLDAGADFERLEIEAAAHFGEAARTAGVKRIVYLGALGSSEHGPLSPHLKSRKEVGNVLRASGVPVLEFQASIILGAGSLSFEMIRKLSERLPVMLMPRWVRTPAQPIHIRDVLHYLVQAVELDLNGHEIFQIGGRDRVSYRDLITEYAKQRGLKRWLIPVPVLTPRLSSLWLMLVTPLHFKVGRKLIESIKNPTWVQDESAARRFPGIQPIGVAEAIAQALRENPDQPVWERQPNGNAASPDATQTTENEEPLPISSRKIYKNSGIAYEKVEGRINP